MLQGWFELISKYKLRAPSDWGIKNVKFHDSVHTTPFSHTQPNSFSMVYLHDNLYFVRLHRPMKIILYIPLFA